MDIFDVRPMTNTVKDANESHEMTIAPVSWEKITRSRIGLRPEQLDGGRSDDAALCARLRRREVDGVLFFKQPFTLQTQGFKPTNPGAQEYMDDSQYFRIHEFIFRLPTCGTQSTQLWV